jgi:hypothetical protein
MFSPAVRSLKPNYQTLVSSFDIRTMTNNPPSSAPDHASNLSVLVNPDRIRSSIKRLFHNRIDEVVAELFQNSQRSGSTTVDITTTENGFTIQDNGHGLLNGIDGFHTLLKLAESNFDNETIEDQDPMGLGIVSLLTHDQITEVTFSSGSLELTIDTKLWWTDPGYYSVWFERMVTLDQPVTGLRISVSCSPDLVKALHDSLTPKDQIYNFTDQIYKSASPAQGYYGILKITLNSQKVRTTLPAWARLNDRLISTTYKGNKLEIGYNETALRSSVLWYGQLILQRGLGNYFDFHLQVTTGRPVNPLSPSRAGIIQDAAYNELLAFIKSEILAFVFDPKNRARIKAAHVEACYKLDASYSLANCPYIVAESIQTSENPNSLEDFNSTSDYDFNNRSINEIFAYDELPLLLNEQVSVHLKGGAVDAEYGLRSFLSETGPAYVLRQGDENRLSIGTLWWKPEGEPQHDWFYQPGHYAISYGDNPPTEWLQITKGPVFTFNDTSNYDANDIDFIVGTAASPIDFLHNQVWAAFSPDDERDYDPQQESYQNSIQDIIRAIIGNCVPRDFTLYQVSRFFKDQAAPIVSITYHYKIGNRFVSARKLYQPDSNQAGAPSPAEITVKSAAGEKVRLKLY